MKNTISVIIPVYNSEKYLLKCLQSISEQEYKDFEVIIVDDGSNDNSPKICDDFCKKDKRFKVIHKKNEGVSIARNLGIDKSNGDYIIFIDSDDYVAPSFIKVLYENIVNYNADISMCNIIRVDQNDNMIDSFDIKRKGQSPVVITMDGNKYISNILDCKYYYTYATNKLIKKTIISNTRFRSDIHYNEDGIFFLDISSMIKKAVFICPVYLYYYLQNNDSANAQQFNEKYATIIKSFEIMEKYFEVFNYNNKCSYAYRYINYLIEENYYKYKKNRIVKIKNKEYLYVIKKFYKYAIRWKEISCLKKFKLILKIIFPKTMLDLKYKKNQKRNKTNS